MIEIRCKEHLQKCLNLAREHNDKTLENCVMRLVKYSIMPWCESVMLRKDSYGENCFYFECIDKNRNCALNGGIIFHGFPESGYKQNGSVQIDPSYGWHIHT